MSREREPVDLDAVDWSPILEVGDDLLKHLRDYLRWENEAKEVGRFTGQRFLRYAVERAEWILKRLQRIRRVDADGHSVHGITWFGPDSPQIVGRIMSKPNGLRPIGFTRRSGDFLDTIHDLERVVSKFRRTYLANTIEPDASKLAPFAPALEVVIQRIRDELKSTLVAHTVGDDSDEELSTKQREALNYIRAHGPVKGAVLARKIGITEGHLRKEVLPSLRSHHGVKNDRQRGGYYVEPG